MLTSRLSKGLVKIVQFTGLGLHQNCALSSALTASMRGPQAGDAVLLATLAQVVSPEAKSPGGEPWGDAGDSPAGSPASEAPTAEQWAGWVVARLPAGWREMKMGTQRGDEAALKAAAAAVPGLDNPGIAYSCFANTLLQCFMALWEVYGGFETLPEHEVMVRALGRACPCTLSCPTAAHERCMGSAEAHACM